MADLLHPVSIGNVDLPSNLFLAPLAGYTDKVYRSICLSKGAALAYTEMVSSEGVARDNDKTVMLMERGEGEKNLAVQLFMPDAETAKRSLENVMKYKPSLIDINCGCPVPKVVKTGAGSALLKRPKTIYEIVKTIKENVPVPVTIKIRTGWDTESLNYLETADLFAWTLVVIIISVILEELVIRNKRNDLAIRPVRIFFKCWPNATDPPVSDKLLNKTFDQFCRTVSDNNMLRSDTKILCGDQTVNLHPRRIH